jgi:hypothetical protein
MKYISYFKKKPIKQIYSIYITVMTSINFYKITSTNTDKVYVGSTKKDINARLQIHEAHYRYFKDGKYNYITSFEFLNVKTIKSNSSKIKFVKAKKNGIRLNVNILLIHLTPLINTFQGEQENNIDKTIKNKSANSKDNITEKIKNKSANAKDNIDKTKKKS